MNIKLVHHPELSDHISLAPHYGRSDCACDCACPTDGAAAPVLARPIAFYLELTPACNNRCPGCGNVYAAERLLKAPSPVPGAGTADKAFSRQERPRDGGYEPLRDAGYAPVKDVCAGPPLTGDGWRALIAQLAPHTQHVKLTGGEPTLHPDFAGIVAALGEFGISFAVFTNARWPDPARVLDTLRAAPTCEGLLVSLHGPDTATHEAFSGVPGSFAETTANLRRAVSAGVDVAASLVITRHNWAHVEATLALALDLGANHVVCNRWIGPPALGLAPEPAHLRAVIAHIEALRAAGQPIRFGNCIPQCFAPSSSTGCTAGATFATIDPWGRVRPCNHAPLVAGDLRAQSLADIWHGPAMQHWRDLVPGGCAACPAFTTCHGGCRAQALLAEIDHDPLMQMPFPLPAPEPEVYLWEGLRPLARGERREEAGRLLLLHQGQVAVVPPELRAGLLPGLDGTRTLRHIQQNYGDAALNWIGGLAQAGLVVWQNIPSRFSGISSDGGDSDPATARRVMPSGETLAVSGEILESHKSSRNLCEEMTI